MWIRNEVPLKDKSAGRGALVVLTTADLGRPDGRGHVGVLFQRNMHRGTLSDLYNYLVTPEVQPLDLPAEHAPRRVAKAEIKKKVQEKPQGESGIYKMIRKAVVVAQSTADLVEEKCWSYYVMMRKLGVVAERPNQITSQQSLLLASHVNKSAFSDVWEASGKTIQVPEYKLVLFGASLDPVESTDYLGIVFFVLGLFMLFFKCCSIKLPKSIGHYRVKTTLNAREVSNAA